MAVAGGLTIRQFGVLIEQDLAPNPVTHAVGKGGTKYWDQFGLGEVAMLGALHKSSVELLMAARLAKAILDDFTSFRGYLPSRLSDYIRSRSLNPKLPNYPFDLTGDEVLRIDDDFWLHHYLRTRTDVYRPGVAIDGDMVLEIADRKYVFSGFAWETKVSTLSSYGGYTDKPVAVEYEIVDWERGAAATVRSFFHDINPDFSVDPDSRKTAREREIEWFAARKNAVSLVRLNLSLAIRNAFDAIHDHRIATGASFDWTATARPPLSRYAGCDDQGYPLDPDHPWNRDLPPLERAKRLVEIEEIINRREAEREARDKKELSGDGS